MISEIFDSYDLIKYDNVDDDKFKFLNDEDEKANVLFMIERAAIALDSENFVKCAESEHVKFN